MTSAVDDQEPVGDGAGGEKEILPAEDYKKEHEFKR